MMPDHAPYRTHAEIIGGTQYGKTWFAHYCRRRHILAGNPVISLDYKSGGYENDVAFIASVRPKCPGVFIDLKDPVPYNVFALPKGRDLATHVKNISQVILKLVSKQPIAELQNYATAAEAFFSYVAVSGEPVSLAMRLFDEPKSWVRLAEKVPEPFARLMRRIGQTAAREWDYKVGTLERRLRPFATSTAMRKLTAKPGIVLRGVL